MFFVYMFFLQDANMRQAVHNPLVQAVLLVAIVWMYIGFTFMNSMINNVA